MFSSSEDGIIEEEDPLKDRALKIISHICTCSVFLLLSNQSVCGREGDYKSARAKFLSDLAYAQSRGVGIASYEKIAREIDVEEAQTSGAGLVRLSALGKKLDEQVTEIEREGHTSIGDEVYTKLWLATKFRKREYSGTSIEFEINRDSSISDFRWLKKSNNPAINKDLEEALHKVSLNKRSPNQVELPVKICVTPFSWADFTVSDPKSGKIRYVMMVNRCKPNSEN